MESLCKNFDFIYVSRKIFHISSNVRSMLSMNQLSVWPSGEFGLRVQESTILYMYSTQCMHQSWKNKSDRLIRIETDNYMFTKLQSCLFILITKFSQFQAYLIYTYTTDIPIYILYILLYVCISAHTRYGRYIYVHVIHETYVRTY